MTEEVWLILNKRAGTSDSAYLFPSPDNAERPLGSVRKAHDGAVRRAKLKTLGALLGHTTVQMTMRYVHPAEEHKREAAGKIENIKAMNAIRLAGKESRGHYKFRYSAMRKRMRRKHILKSLVGAPGFEPGASCAQGRRATRLRYAPT